MKSEIAELEEMYDMSPDPDDIISPPLNDDLTDEERGEVDFFMRFKRGVILITGEPGGGKDALLHFICHKMKILFKGLNVLLDHKPRPLFGKYVLFNEETLLNEYKFIHGDKAKDAAAIEDETAKQQRAEAAFADYMTKRNRALANGQISQWRARNESLYTNAVMGLSEFWNYFYNRRPHNPMNYALMPLAKRHRHYDLSLIGTTPHVHELDVKSCLNYVTHLITAAQTGIPGVHAYKLEQYRYYAGNTIVNTAIKPIIFTVDYIDPQVRLGGEGYYKIYNSYERDEKVPKITL